MLIEDRWYQKECAKALFDSVVNKPKKSPVVAIPTGGGKTIIIGLFLKMYFKKFPYNKVCVMSHTQEIVQQDHEALQEFFPHKEIGLFSAGLKSKSINQITVGGIQSIYPSKHLFKYTNLYIIDECHSVNHKSKGIYRAVLDSTKAIVVGMSATVFRTGHGYIYENGALFDSLVYDLTSVDNFNRLVKEKYLTNLISVAPQTQLDSSNIRKSAGDYNVKALGDAFDRDNITKAAVKEIKYYGKNYKKWLIFAIDTEHADNICRELRRLEVDAHVLHSKMSHSRQATLARFKEGDTRCLVSVGMITTGFDAKNVDLIGVLRNTCSAVLHVQMIGRGLRVCEGSDHCLVLDFAGNTARLGPINDVVVPKQKGNKKGKAPVKLCPKCRSILPLSAKSCKTCGEVFETKTKLEKTASTVEIVRKVKIQKELIRWMKVDRVAYQIYHKIGRPDSVLVLYFCGVKIIREWVHPLHSGYAKRQALHWLAYRHFQGIPTPQGVIDKKNTIAVPKQLKVDLSGKFDQILDYVF